MNLVGERFGRLEVLSLSHRRKYQSCWFCRCSCGASKIVAGNHLRSGGIRSCGCLRKEETSKRSKRHGLTGSKEHRIWKGIIQRSTNPKLNGYERYLGRGITVCKKWRSFEGFFADMGCAPIGMSIGRKNNDAGYCKRNCRWETTEQQARNRRSNIKIKIGGVTKCATEWAEIYGVDPRNVIQRISRYGWSPERALSC